MGIVLGILALRLIALREVRRKVEDVKRAYHWRRLVNYGAGLVLVLLVARTWISGLQNLGTFLGLLSAGVAVALSDPLSNLAGWLFILARRPYVVGDRIEIDGHVGDVIDIRLFQSFLLECGQWVDADQSTGRIVMVPNNRVFKSTTANYTHGFEYIWDEIEVLITFESDWKRAKQLMIEIARDHAQPLSEGAQEQIRRAARQHMIFFRNLTPIVYTAVKDSGVQFSIRYLTHPRHRRGSAERLWEAILEAFGHEPQIDLAYPTQRFFANHREGKPQMRADAPTDGAAAKIAPSPAPRRKSA
jgi:small-conductance mechanosensitive channel